jgi:hypothetical protein
MAAADQVLTAGVSVIPGYGGKMAQDWWSARRAQKQPEQGPVVAAPAAVPAPAAGAMRKLEARLSELAADGNEPRRDDRAVQLLRKRMCYELNFATSSLYRTARYLAQARLVHQHLFDFRRAGAAGGAAGRDLRLELGPRALVVASVVRGPAGPVEAVEDQVEPERVLVPVLVAGPQDVLPGDLGQVRELVGPGTRP